MAQLDYFERRGCYELAREMLIDSLRQLIADPDAQEKQTHKEREWLKGLSLNAPISCAQVLQTLGMQPGKWQSLFVEIALSEPRRALQMLTSREVYRTLADIDAGSDSLAEPSPRAAEAEQDRAEGLADLSEWRSPLRMTM